MPETIRVVSQYNDQFVNYSDEQSGQIDQACTELRSYAPFQALVRAAGITPDAITQMSASRSIKGELLLTVYTDTQEHSFVPTDSHIREVAEYLLHPDQKPYPKKPTLESTPRSATPLPEKVAPTPPAGQEVLLEAIREWSKAQMKMAEEHRASIEILAKALADRNVQPVSHEPLLEVVRELARTQIRLLEMLVQNRPTPAAPSLQPELNELRDQLSALSQQKDNHADQVIQLQRSLNDLEAARRSGAEEQRRAVEQMQKAHTDQVAELERKHNRELAALRTSFEQTQKTHADQVTRLQTSLNGLPTRNDLETARRSGAEEQRRALEQMQKTHAEEIAALERSFVQLRQQVSDEQRHALEQVQKQSEERLAEAAKLQKKQQRQIEIQQQRLQHAEGTLALYERFIPTLASQQQVHELRQLFEASQARTQTSISQFHQRLNERPKDASLQLQLDSLQRQLDSLRPAEEDEKEQPDELDLAIERMGHRISEFQERLSEEEVSENDFLPLSEEDLLREEADEMAEIIQRTDERLSRLEELLQEPNRQSEVNELPLVQELSEEESSPSLPTSEKSPHWGSSLFAERD